MQYKTPIQFDIAVFAMNEAAEIKSCVASIDRACDGYKSRISVILNGTTDDSRSILERTKLKNASLRIYASATGDKANAINYFLYSVRDREAMAHFFIDGYVSISLDALRALADALASHRRAHIASGVPLSGRSAKAVVDEVRAGSSGVRGNLFAIRPAFANRIVAAQLHLPRGLYRGDGLLGAMAKHDLDPLHKRWDDNRVIGVLDATYTFRSLSPFRWRDIQRVYRRKIRVAQGRIENEALKEIAYRDGYTALPRDNNELILAWLQKHKPVLRTFQDKFFTYLAIKRISSQPRIDSIQTELVFELEV